MGVHVDWQNSFLSSLIERLSQEPSMSLNPHCLSERTLYDLFDEFRMPSGIPQPPKRQRKQWLEEIGLLTLIPIDEYPKGSTPNTRFYRLDITKKSRSHPSPLELLQAYDSTGVICYFTAVAFHTLTTQPPVHHHLAILTEPRTRTVTTSSSPEASSRPPRAKADPLGTRLFTCQGIPYYRTSREKRLLSGIQTRCLSATALIRITTLEQTLLDTLHRPISCGGPAVVTEAWEQGLRRLNEDKLARHLQDMDHLPIAQRLGYVLAALDYQPGPSLKATLDSYLARLNPDDPAACQQLFPGVRYEHLHHPWLVYGPD